MHYTVERMERHASLVVIEANSPEEAIELVNDGYGDEIYLEYVETLPIDTWSARLS